MLQIHCAPVFQQERQYILKVIFESFWGIPYQIVWEPRETLLFREDGKCCVELDDSFFQQPEKAYLTAGSLPCLPLVQWNPSEKFQRHLLEERVPVLYGHRLENGGYFMEKAGQLKLGLDVFGAAFFMLTGYEEYVKPQRDMHGRFLSVDSLAFQQGFLERPIINEYLEILWTVLQRADLVHHRKIRRYRLLPTHDVDAPFDLYLQPEERKAELLKEPMPDGMSAEERLHVLREAEHGNWQADPSYSFETIMRMSEGLGLSSRFYFMNAQGRSAADGNFDADAPVILRTMRNISARGHEIGLHASYASFHNEAELREEAGHMRRMLAAAQLPSDVMGLRVHYLRWSCPDSWQAAENAGIQYDSTLGFADRAGFRCGICYAYPVFNLKTRQELQLLEQPLIVMDRSLLCEKYMGLNGTAAFSYMRKLENACRKYQGDFVILWHTHVFRDPLYRMVYEKFMAQEDRD